MRRVNDLEREILNPNLRDVTMTSLYRMFYSCDVNEVWSVTSEPSENTNGKQQHVLQ